MSEGAPTPEQPAHDGTCVFTDDWLRVLRCKQLLRELGEEWARLSLQTHRALGGQVGHMNAQSVVDYCNDMVDTIDQHRQAAEGEQLQ